MPMTMQAPTAKKEHKLFLSLQKRAKAVNIDVIRLKQGRLENGTIMHFMTTFNGKNDFHYGYHSMFELIKKVESI